MRCSRVALSLMLAVLGGAVIALGISDGRKGVAGGIGPVEPPYMESSNRANHLQSATDWCNNDATDGEVSSTDGEDACNTICQEGIAETATQDDEYEYGNEYAEYGYKDQGNYEYVCPQEKYGNDEGQYAEETESDASQEDEEDYSYDYDAYESDYADDDQDAYAEDEYQYGEETELDTSQEEEEDYSYGYDAYESDYADDDQDAYADDEYQYGEETELDAEEAAEEDYSYGYDAYGTEYDEADDASSSDDSGYEGYSEAYPNEEHAYVDDEYTYEYEYSYPEQKYGYRPDDEWTAEESAAQSADDDSWHESRLELSAWLPSELLISSDWETLRSLAGLFEEPTSVRQATFSEHLDNLGTDATDFAMRFEETTGVEILGFADDLPGAAALLATFRLIEQGAVEVDEGIDLLWRGLEGLTGEWIDDVTEMTAEPIDDEPAAEQPEVFDEFGSSTHTFSGVVASWAIHSFGTLTFAFQGISRQINGLDRDVSGWWPPPHTGG